MDCDQCTVATLHGKPMFTKVTAQWDRITSHSRIQNLKLYHFNLGLHWRSFNCWVYLRRHDAHPELALCGAKPQRAHTQISFSNARTRNGRIVIKEYYQTGTNQYHSQLPQGNCKFINDTIDSEWLLDSFLAVRHIRANARINVTPQSICSEPERLSENNSFSEVAENGSSTW